VREVELHAVCNWLATWKTGGVSATAARRHDDDQWQEQKQTLIHDSAWGA